jgi:hypothetical protein
MPHHLLESRSGKSLRDFREPCAAQGLPEMKLPEGASFLQEPSRFAALLDSLPQWHIRNRRQRLFRDRALPFFPARIDLALWE